MENFHEKMNNEIQFALPVSIVFTPPLLPLPQLPNRQPGPNCILSSVAGYGTE